MCGIAGFIGVGGAVHAQKMVDKIKHRGPDADGIWIAPESESPAVFCHTRLSILDLSDAAAQPFHSSDGRYVLVFNGEIYNFIELREALIAKGCVFKSDSDTEVLLAGLIHEGPSFQAKCNGMWAFCLWDRQTHTALFGRDRFGVKPLFYARLPGKKIAFSSEMKGIAHLLSSIKPDQQIDYYFSHQFEYESTSHSVIEDVHRLPPGHVATFKDGEIVLRRWWSTLDHIDLAPPSYAAQVEQWRDIFLDAVKLRMRADVRIGTALSGGLDSSSVFAAMNYISASGNHARLASDWRHAFCASYEGSSLDETSWARSVAESCGTPFEAVAIDPLNSQWSIKQALAQVEDPYLTIPLPMLATYRAIKNAGISVTIDGHGSDELFSGYGHLKQALSCVATRKEFAEILAIDESCRTGVYSEREKLKVRTLLRHRLKILISDYFPARLRRFLGGLLPSRLARGSSRFLFTESPVESDMKLIANHPAFQAMDVFSQVMYELFHVTILPTLLRNYDRYSMASGVEIRMPFMDWRLVCFTFSLPWQSKLGGTYTKRIQRDALAGILIDPVRLRRDKIGWNAPSHEWFRGPLANSVDSWLNDSSLAPYHSRALKAWHLFQGIEKPSFRDGEVFWNDLLPFLWTQSLTEEAWS